MVSHQPSFEHSRALFAQLGVAVTEVKGKCWFNGAAVCRAHDGVPYCMDPADPFGTRSLEQASAALKRLDLLVQRHHRVIKQVYLALQARSDEPLWVMAGGGRQLQAFFGTTHGYIARMGLSLLDPDLGTGPQVPVLAVEDLRRFRHLHLFDGFDVPGVKLRLS